MDRRGIVQVTHSNGRTSPLSWHEISTNPDDPRVIKWRDAQVRASADKPLARYEDVIQTYCAGQRVMDFGAANHAPQTTSIAALTTHDLVAKHAREVVAVDIVPFAASLHPNCSYYVGDLLSGDAWERSSIRPFDALFAGHVIEHLDNPGAVFALAAKALRPQGTVVVVTPNPIWLPAIWGRSSYSNLAVNVDHVALFGAGELLEMAARHSFEIRAWRYAGRADMVRSLSRLDGPNGRLVNAAYRFSRWRDLPFAHNSVVGVFALAGATRGVAS